MNYCVKCNNPLDVAGESICWSCNLAADASKSIKDIVGRIAQGILSEGEVLDSAELAKQIHLQHDPTLEAFFIARRLTTRSGKRTAYDRQILSIIALLYSASLEGLLTHHPAVRIPTKYSLPSKDS